MTQEYVALGKWGGAALGRVGSHDLLIIFKSEMLHGTRKEGLLDGILLEVLWY